MGLAGIGAPTLAIPVLATIYDVPTAISIMILPLLISSSWQIWLFRDARQNCKMLIPLLSACAVGVGFETFLVGAILEAWPAILLGVLLYSYVGLYLFRPDVVLSAELAARISVPVGFSIGALQGAAGGSTPIRVTFVHAQRLERAPYMYCYSQFFRC